MWQANPKKKELQPGEWKDEQIHCLKLLNYPVEPEIQILVKGFWLTETSWQLFFYKFRIIWRTLTWSYQNQLQNTYFRQNPSHYFAQEDFDINAGFVKALL